MGVFNKLKNIFYDEEEVVEPTEVKKEVKKEPIIFNEPIKQEEVKIVRDEVVNDVKTENTYTERELFRSERTFNFTEFDDDVEDIPPRRNVMDIEKKTSRVEASSPKIEAPKTFKPTPIISPIYGIIDSKEAKEEYESHSKGEKKSITYDTVRKKAFKNYNNEVEDTIDITTEKVKKTMDDVESEIQKLNEKTNKIEDLINRIENTNSSVTLGDMEDLAKEDIIKDAIKEETEEDIDDRTITDDTLEHDLFNLIDSMYDDKED